MFVAGLVVLIIDLALLKAEEELQVFVQHTKPSAYLFKLVPAMMGYMCEFMVVAFDEEGSLKTEHLLSVEDKVRSVVFKVKDDAFYLGRHLLVERHSAF